MKLDKSAGKETYGSVGAERDGSDVTAAKGAKQRSCGHGRSYVRESVRAQRERERERGFGENSGFFDGGLLGFRVLVLFIQREVRDCSGGERWAWKILV